MKHLLIVILFLYGVERMQAAEDKPMTLETHIKQLLLTLANEDTTSEAHDRPDGAIHEAQIWTNKLIRHDRLTASSELKTVQKPGLFQFIDEAHEGMIIRQTPEIFMIKLTLPTNMNLWNLLSDIANFKLPKGQDFVVLDDSQTTKIYGLGENFRDGTYMSTAVAVSDGKYLFFFLPKRSSKDGTKEYSYSQIGNCRWFLHATSKSKL